MGDAGVAIGDLKLVQLRAELQARSLAAEGSKAELVARLRDALDAERSAAAAGDDGARAKRPRIDDDAAGAHIRGGGGGGGGGGSGGDDDSDDSDVGPALPAGYVGSGAADDDTGGDGGSAVAAPGGNSDASAQSQPPAPVPRRRRRLEHEAAYLDSLPSAAMYEKSYMHRAQLTATLVTPAGSDFIVTGSAGAQRRGIGGSLAAAGGGRCPLVRRPTHLLPLVTFRSTPRRRRRQVLEEDPWRDRVRKVVPGAHG